MPGWCVGSLSFSLCVGSYIAPALFGCSTKMNKNPKPEEGRLNFHKIMHVHARLVDVAILWILFFFFKCRRCVLSMPSFFACCQANGRPEAGFLQCSTRYKKKIQPQIGWRILRPIYSTWFQLLTCKFRSNISGKTFSFDLFFVFLTGNVRAVHLSRSHVCRSRNSD